MKAPNCRKESADSVHAVRANDMESASRVRAHITSVEGRTPSSREQSKRKVLLFAANLPCLFIIFPVGHNECRPGTDKVGVGVALVATCCP